MIEVVCKWLLENYPLVIIGAMICWASWKLRGLYHRFEKTEADCKRIDDKISPQLNAILSNLNSLVIFLGVKHDDMDTGLFITRSPVQLTDLGSH